MSRTILQVPMSKELYMSAKKAAMKQGFSSLQEIIRVFLRQLVRGDIEVRIDYKDAS